MDILLRPRDFTINELIDYKTGLLPWSSVNTCDCTEIYIFLQEEEILSAVSTAALPKALSTRRLYHHVYSHLFIIQVC